MPLGWVDFSKTERNKVLDVLSLLSEKGILDELGTAPIRDGFSNLFFPGITTIETRAKYFLIVPYVMKDLEHSQETSPAELQELQAQEEKRCAEIFLSGNPKEIGVIGSRSMNQPVWVKRTPASIYWNGLRVFGIFCGGGLSITEYFREMAKLKKQKDFVRSLGNMGGLNGRKEEAENDDWDAGDYRSVSFWKIPTYEKHWMDTLTMCLSRKEAEFLRSQMIRTQGSRLLGFILRENLEEVLKCSGFKELAVIEDRFPEDIRNAFDLAVRASDFLYILHAAYNIQASAGTNEEAKDVWENSNLLETSDVPFEEIYKMLSISGNYAMKNFIREAQAAMKASDLDEMKRLIRSREVYLKGTARARTVQPSEIHKNTWFDDRELSYRFGNAKTILADIFESVSAC